MADNLNQKDIDYNTYFSNRIYESMKKSLQKYESDEEIETRSKRRLCKTCYYLRRNTLSGQAFTTSKCDNCGKEIVNPTTNTSSVCEECSDKLNVCVKCGGRL